jgi:hypothetical protein
LIRNVRSALSEANVASQKQKQKIRNQKINRKNDPIPQNKKNNKARKTDKVQKKTNIPKKNASKQKRKRLKGKVLNKKY